jgi:hypothetical protein
MLTKELECNVCFRVIGYVFGRDAGWTECLTCYGTPAALKAHEELSVDAYQRRKRIKDEISLTAVNSAIEETCSICDGLGATREQEDSLGQFAILTCPNCQND